MRIRTSSSSCARVFRGGGTGNLEAWHRARRGSVTSLSHSDWQGSVGSAGKQASGPQGNLEDCSCGVPECRSSQCLGCLPSSPWGSRVSVKSPAWAWRSGRSGAASACDAAPACSSGCLEEAAAGVTPDPAQRRKRDQQSPRKLFPGLPHTLPCLERHHH